MITIFVGDITEDLSLAACQFDPAARIITQDNSQNLDNGTYYTSLGDFKTLRPFIATLEQADELVYVQPTQWSDSASKGLMQHWTEYYLKYLSLEKEVFCIDHLLTTDHYEKYQNLASARHNDNQHLWIVGGSDANGVGIDADQRFGHILGEQLDLPVSWLTANASSLEWAADQILRSDICKDDIVVWSLVPNIRFPYFDNNSVVHATISHYSNNPNFNDAIDLKHLDDENNLLYRPVRHISQVVNFCNKIGAKLVIAGLDVPVELQSFYLTLSNFVHLHGNHGMDTSELYLDFGTDGKHPGVRTHQWIAEKILEEIEK